MEGGEEEEEEEEEEAEEVGNQNLNLSTPLLDETFDQKDLPLGDPAGRQGSWGVKDFKRSSSEASAQNDNDDQTVDVTFSEISYAVKVKNGSNGDDNFLSILNGINGRLPSSTLTALMGASGAGKSTLLDLLAGRKKKDKNTLMGGSVLFNGAPRSRSMEQKSAYVTQDNVHLESLTVGQTIACAAELRMENR